MTGTGQRFAIGMVIGAGAFAALGIACLVGGIRINTTASIPVGVYRTISAPVEKGAYVLVCPPSTTVFAEAKSRGYLGAGFCPDGIGFLMKRVLAVAPDVVSINREGVRVNGDLLPLSRPLSRDAQGRLLPVFASQPLMLDAAEVLLMSDVSATSFDGRYYGPVHRSHIQSVIVPVLTWPGRTMPTVTTGLHAALRPTRSTSISQENP